MSKVKYAYEDFKVKLNELGLKIIEGNYDNCRSLFTVINKEGYMAKTTPYRILNDMEIRYFHPINKYVINNVKNFLKINNSNIELISNEYSKATDKLTFKCKEHNLLFDKTVKNIRKYCFCPMCSKNGRYTLQEIKDKLKELKLEWLDGVYNDANSKITVIDKKGYKCSFRIISIMQGNIPNMFHHSNMYILDNIRLFLNKNFNNIILLSKEYIDSKTSLEFKCLEHDYLFKTTWTQLNTRFKGCPKCTGSYVSTVEEVVEMLENINPNIVIEKETYRDNKRGFICRCLIDDNVWFSSFSDLITNPHGCRVCGYNNISGENNYNYNHDKTLEEREVRREYSEYYGWRKDVYERDNYICQCCNYDKGGKLNAHHLYSYTKHRNMRTDIRNGITLCRDCHESFHKLYGYKDNTLEQFKEFYKKEFNRELTIEIVLP